MSNNNRIGASLRTLKHLHENLLQDYDCTEQTSPHSHQAGRQRGGNRRGAPSTAARSRTRHQFRHSCPSLDPSTVTLLVFLHEAIPGGIEREAYEIIDAALEIQDD
jgi:hypothetical protein